MKKTSHTFALQPAAGGSSQLEHCTLSSDLYYGEPVNARWHPEAASRLVQALPPAVLDVIQDQLLALLGKGYQVVLSGSEAEEGAAHYHVQISHEPTGLSLEQHERIDAGFLEGLFTLATQMRAMLEQRATLQRMGGSGQVRLLTWISDDISPALLSACHQAHHRCVQALQRLRG